MPQKWWQRPLSPKIYPSFVFSHSWLSLKKPFFSSEDRWSLLQSNWSTLNSCEQTSAKEIIVPIYILGKFYIVSKISRTDSFSQREFSRSADWQVHFDGLSRGETGSLPDSFWAVQNYFVYIWPSSSNSVL